MGLLFQIYQTVQDEETELQVKPGGHGGSETGEERISLIELLARPWGRDEAERSLGGQRTDGRTG